MATKPKAASAARAPVPAPIAEPEAAAPTEIVAVEAVVADPEEPAAPAVVMVEAVVVETVAPPVPVKQHMEKVVKTAEEFVAFGQGNVEAFVKSSQIWAAGVQDLSKQAAATAQAQFEDTMSVFKAMTSIKSVKDLFELQSTYAKAAVEKTMSESGKLTDASMKLTEQALAPIAARVTIAVETFSKAA